MIMHACQEIAYKATWSKHSQFFPYYPIVDKHLDLVSRSAELADYPVDIGRHLGVEAGKLGAAAADAGGHDSHQLVGVVVQLHHQRAARVALITRRAVPLPALGPGT